nr:reverse transcriptase domain, reverse transcriptase zinc-binding domain protein [Tanacetum cinerariifolium]
MNEWKLRIRSTRGLDYFYGEVKKVLHYLVNQKLLLVGEGAESDLQYAAFMARAFGKDNHQPLLRLKVDGRINELKELGLILLLMLTQRNWRERLLIIASPWKPNLGSCKQYNPRVSEYGLVVSIVAREGIPYEPSPATFPGRQVAGERNPQRQIVGVSPRLSLGKAVNVVVFRTLTTRIPAFSDGFSDVISDGFYHCVRFFDGEPLHLFVCNCQKWRLFFSCGSFISGCDYLWVVLTRFDPIVPSLKDEAKDPFMWESNDGKYYIYSTNREWKDWRMKDNKDATMAAMTQLRHNRSIKSVLRRIILAACVYFIWNERNKRLFTSDKKDSKELTAKIVNYVRLKLTSLTVKRTSQTEEISKLWKVELDMKLDDILLESLTEFMDHSCPAYYGVFVISQVFLDNSLSLIQQDSLVLKVFKHLGSESLLGCIGLGRNTCIC